MHKTITGNVRRACGTGILGLLVLVAPVRASINLGDSSSDAASGGEAAVPADNSLAVNAGTPSGNEVVNNAPTSTSEAKAAESLGNSAPADGEDVAMRIVSGSVSSQAITGSNGTVLDVLNKNVDAAAPKVDAPLVDPRKLATGIRPDDAVLGRPAPLVSPDVDMTPGVVIHEPDVADVVF